MATYYVNLYADEDTAWVGHRFKKQADAEEAGSSCQHQVILEVEAKAGKVSVRVIKTKGKK
jgi:hypothetical protein